LLTLLLQSLFFFVFWGVFFGVHVRECGWVGGLV
jgi:hypothetical protein